MLRNQTENVNKLWERPWIQAHKHMSPKPRRFFWSFSLYDCRWNPNPFNPAANVLVPAKAHAKQTQLWYGQWSTGTFYLPTTAGANFKDPNLVPCTPRRKFEAQKEAEMFTHTCMWQEPSVRLPMTPCLHPGLQSSHEGKGKGSPCKEKLAPLQGELERELFLLILLVLQI